MDAPPKPSGRWHRRAGITLVITAAVLGAMVLASLRWWIGYSGRRVEWSLGAGSIQILTADAPLLWNEGWQSGVIQSRVLQWWHWEWDRGAMTSGRTGVVVQLDYYVVVPSWPAPVAIALTGWWFWRGGTKRLRGAIRGLCRRCGYSLAGLAVGAACPECGASRSGTT